MYNNIKFYFHNYTHYSKNALKSQFLSTKIRLYTLVPLNDVLLALKVVPLQQSRSKLHAIFKLTFAIIYSRMVSF